MNKKEIKKILYDDKEDLEITQVANYKINNQNILFYILISTFIVFLFITLSYINTYYKFKDNHEFINITNSRNTIIINNDSLIEETITSDIFNKKDYIVEKISIISFETNKKSSSNGFIALDVKYNILKNDFDRNVFSDSDSPVLVRFSYSYDNVNWEYINNVISTNESTLTPMMGHLYDISGLKTQLNVSTNFKLTNEIGKKTTMYWRSETIFKYKKDYGNENNFEAEFKIINKNNN